MKHSKLQVIKNVMDIKEDQHQWCIIFFDKKSSDSDVNNEIKQNIQLADELHKSIIRKFKKRKVYSSIRDNIWGADLADMQLLNKFNKDSGSYYVLLILIVIMLGLFL